METSSWSQELPWVLIGIRSAPRDADGVSAAERDFGTPICLPGDFLDTQVPPADSFINKLKTLVENSAPALSKFPSPKKLFLLNLFLI